MTLRRIESWVFVLAHYSKEERRSLDPGPLNQMIRNFTDRPSSHHLRSTLCRYDDDNGVHRDTASFRLSVKAVHVNICLFSWFPLPGRNVTQSPARRMKFKTAPPPLMSARNTSLLASRVRRICSTLYSILQRLT